jgi:hypothetical protein
LEQGAAHVILSNPHPEDAGRPASMPRRTPDPNEGHGLPLPLEEVQAIVTRKCSQFVAKLGHAGAEDAAADYMHRYVLSGRLAEKVERRGMDAAHTRHHVARSCGHYASNHVRALKRQRKREALVAEMLDGPAPPQMSVEASEWLDRVLDRAADVAASCGLGLAWTFFDEYCVMQGRSDGPASTTRELAKAHGVAEATVRLRIDHAREIAIRTLMDALRDDPDAPLHSDTLADLLPEREDSA